MTPLEAATLLGLSGKESPEQIRSIYEAQAAALDARIASSEGEARERYRKDREEVELARLALFGSDVRRPEAAPPKKASTAMQGFLGDILFALGAVALFAIPSAITGWFIPIPGHSPRDSAIVAAMSGPVWLLCGVAISWVVEAAANKLFGWKPGVYVFVIYLMGSHLASRPVEKLRTAPDVLMQIFVTAIMGTMGAGLAVGIATMIILVPVNWLRGKPPSPPKQD